MTIAIHISLKHPEDYYSDFNFNCFSVLANSYPAHHFIFIFDKPFDVSIIKEKNITPVLAGPIIKNRLLQHYFYNFKIPRILGKYNADYFVSAGVCSLRTTVRQLLILHDLSFLQKQNHYLKNDARYLKRYTRHFLGKASWIGVMNAHLKSTLISRYTIPENKISVLHTAIDNYYVEINEDQAEQLRVSLTSGKQYFLFFATRSAAPNLMVMLKAFSIFKKWQKSNMQLLLLFSDLEKAPVIKSLANYKYREDVKIIDPQNRQNTGEIIAAAYAAIHLPSTEISEKEGFMPLASGVPLVITNSDFYKSSYGDAALYSVPEEKVLAENLMLLYKDENTRNKLILRGKALAAANNWASVAEKIWLTMLSDAAG